MKFHDMTCNKAPVEIVHKHREDDVFIYNCRAALPTFLRAEELDLSALDNDDLLAISNCYQCIDTGPDVLGKAYILKNIPWKIQLDFNRSENSCEKINRWLAENYSETHHGHVLKNQFIPEATQNEMTTALAGCAPTELTRYRAAEALKKINGAPVNPILHCTIYNDTKHYFFYGKRHEHVPGIMVMEIARQAFYAHFYRFSKHTRASVNITIMNFNCEFTNYLQSNYPALIAVETLSRVVEGPSREKQHLRATFTQRGQLACVIEMIGTAVSTKLFKKLRDVKPPADHAFSMIGSDAMINFLLAYADGYFVEGELLCISSDTLIVRTPELTDPINTTGIYKFHIFTQQREIIAGSGVLDPNHARAKNGAIAIHITDWSKGSAAKFREFLKMDCYLIESDLTIA